MSEKWESSRVPSSRRGQISLPALGHDRPFVKAQGLYLIFGMTLYLLPPRP
jgi:hypothetical protein